MGPLLQQGAARTNNRFSCLPAEGGQSCFLYGVRVGVCPGVGPDGWLRWSAHPFGGVVCKGHAQCPAFAPGSSRAAVGLFGLFVSFGSRICPSCACTQLFLVPYSFFVFCCSRRGVSRCKHCSKGSQVPAKGHRSQAFLKSFDQEVLEKVIRVVSKTLAQNITTVLSFRIWGQTC